MKHLFLLLLITPLVLVSCSKDEPVSDSNFNQKMLESYVIKRNANGSYTMSHVVSEGVNTVYNDDLKANEIQLYFDGKAVNNTFSRVYDVTNNELNINFVSENSTFQPKIKIIDDNTSEKGVYGLLNDYTVTENSDGTVVLNFVVDSGVKVEYAFNDAEKIYEIVLSNDSSATQQTFSKSYTRNSDGVLKVDFIQPSLTKDDAVDYKKPRLICIGGSE